MTKIIIVCQCCGKPVKQLSKEITKDGDLEILIYESHGCQDKENPDE